jgi:hypothetical protein
MTRPLITPVPAPVGDIIKALIMLRIALNGASRSDIQHALNIGVSEIKAIRSALAASSLRPSIYAAEDRTTPGV